MQVEMQSQLAKQKQDQEGKQERTRGSDMEKFGGAMEKQTQVLADLVKEIGKPRTRKGKIKGPSGRVFEMEVAE
jgi:hypothetical protein